MKYLTKKVFALLTAVFMILGLFASFGTDTVSAKEKTPAGRKSETVSPQEQFKTAYPKLQALADNGSIGLKFEKRPVKQIITLGEYLSDDGKRCGDDIEWEILEIAEDGKSALVISKYLLAWRQYYEGGYDQEITWEESSLRKWLNSEYINAIFTDDERALIKTVTVQTPDYESYYDETFDGGNDTEDRMFLLSREEVDKYYLPEVRDPEEDYDDLEIQSRICRFKNGEVCDWILRSRGDIDDRVAVVTYEGRVDSDGNYVYNGVRPAFWVELTPQIIEKNDLSVKSATKEQTDVYVTFGSYDIPDSEGDTDGRKEALEWLICDYDEKSNRVLLLSRYLVRDMKYYYDDMSNVWESSDVRSWLNGEFYGTAFSGDEAVRIENTAIKDPGTDTVTNKVFIFSVDEVEKYLKDYDLRFAPYSDGQTDAWWLRTPGNNYHCATGIDGENPQYYCECYFEMGVRPAVYIDLDPDLSAADVVPEIPFIAAEPSSDNNGIVVSIDRTYDSEGYEIFIKGADSDEYVKNADLQKDGTKKRSCTVRNLAPGEYSVKVRAYRNNEKVKTYGDFSEEIKIGIEGYADAGFVKENYPKLQKLADKGVIGFNSEYDRDILKFGKWDDKDIVWDVLEYSADGKSALVMSRNILCDRYYNDKDEYVTWKDCSLRKWLNDDFLKSAFSKSERKLIKTTKITNEKNKVYGTKGGKKTKDKVFLLSASEYEQYLENCSKNGYTNRSIGFTIDGRVDSYWLRTVGREGDDGDFSDWDWEDWEDYEEEDFCFGYAANVYEDGDLFWDGTGVAFEKLGVRPVMWIKLTDKIINDNGLTVGKNRRLSELYVSFGSTENDDGSEPLEWKILEYDEKNNRVLLFSRYLVTTDAYNYTGNVISNKGITWAESTIRSLLNGEFHDSSFNDAEKKLIKKVKITNEDNKKTKTKGGKKTKDKIFLLSVSEVEKYFGSVAIDKDSQERIGRFRDGEIQEWWLRSPGNGTKGKKSDCASYVSEDGDVCYNFHSTNGAGIRPALWIDLK